MTAVALALGALAVLGDKLGLSDSLRITLAGAAALAAVILVGLTVVQVTAAWRENRRRQNRTMQRLARFARGVRLPEEPGGDYFQGRARALQKISAWLADPSPRAGVLAIVANAGSGKSAVLGRIIAESSHGIDLFLDCKGQTVAGTAAAIASLLGLAEGTPDELVDAIAVRRDKPLILALDSIDEAQDHAEAIARLLAQLVSRGRLSSVRVLAATRAGGPHRGLVRALGLADVIDLDSPEYFEVQDMVRATEVRLSRDPLAPARYRREPELTGLVARAVAGRALPSFLVAWAAARQLVHNSDVPDVSEPGWQLRLPGNAHEAMAGEFDIERYTTPDDRRLALNMLTALAFTRGRGITIDGGGLWPLIANAISETSYDNNAVDRVFATSAGDLVVRTLEDDGSSSYKLFHQELVAYLRDECDDPEPQIERRITRALLDTVPVENGLRVWESASWYVRAHLSGHAAAAGMLGAVINDSCFLLTADQHELLAVLPAVEAEARPVARAYRQAAGVLSATSPEESPAYLEMAARKARAIGLADEIAAHYMERPWTVPWALSRTSAHRVIARHLGEVPALAIGQRNGRPVLVSGGEDETIHIRDLVDGSAVGTPIPVNSYISDVKVLECDDRATIVASSRDGVIRTFSLANLVLGVEIQATGCCEVVAVGECGGVETIVSGGTDGKVRRWALASGQPIGEPLAGHDGGIRALAVGECDGVATIVSGDSEGIIRRWALASGQPIGEPLAGHDGGIRALAVGECDGVAIIASGGIDGTVRRWALTDGQSIGEPLSGMMRTPVSAVAVGDVEGCKVIVSGGSDARVRIWDLADGESYCPPLVGHELLVESVALGDVDGRPTIASAGEDGAVRVWDILDIASDEGSSGPHGDKWVSSVCFAQLNDQRVLVSAGGDIRIWDCATGSRVSELASGRSIIAIVVEEIDGRRLIGALDYAGDVGIYELETSASVGEIGPEDDDKLVSIGSARRGDTLLIIVATAGGSLRVWDSARGGLSREISSGLRGDILSPFSTCTYRDAPYVAYADRDVVQVWALDGSPSLRTLAIPRSSMIAIGDISDRLALVNVDSSGVLSLWDVAEGKCLAERQIDGDLGVGTVSIAKLLDQTVVIVGGSDGGVHLWTPETDEERRIKIGAGVRRIAAQDRILAVATTEGLVCIEFK